MQTVGLASKVSVISSHCLNPPPHRQFRQTISTFPSPFPLRIVCPHAISLPPFPLHNLRPFIVTSQIDDSIGFTSNNTSFLFSAVEKLSLLIHRILALLSLALQTSISMANAAMVTLTMEESTSISNSSALILASSSKPPRMPEPLEDDGELTLHYDAKAIAAYFTKRPLVIISRSLKIIFECAGFVIRLLLDEFRGLRKQNEKLRASQLVELISRLGPTVIKIGQALSIRPDILPTAYLEELQKLQDRVPPFSTEEARKIISEGLKRPVEEVFSEISPEPVSAASLGQVYKVRLRENGKLAAVKVRRPGVLEGISRDLYLLRKAAHLAQSWPGVQSDLVAILDNWADRFYDELDYIKEGMNAERFASDMRSLPNIVVPRVYMQYTSQKVITSVWVDGKKLSESKAEDLLYLVKTALSCYLMQLLETGFLHADPHPGNLLRTSDGSLCILDYGLMTEVTEDQRYTIIEYISHLLYFDYARVADDLVRLGFVPAELADPEKTASIVPQLSRIFGQLVQGGGVRKVNISQILDDLSKMAEDYVFVIPPYFALILRTFALLEGIGLEVNPDYTIVRECFPYLSKRLLTDDSQRTRAALKNFLYAGKEQLDMERVEDIMSGFQTFRELTAPPAIVNQISAAPLVDPATKEVLHLLFAPEGSYIQELLLTELVRAADALSCDALAEMWQYFASRLVIPLPPPLYAPKSWPLLFPGFFWGSLPIATLSEEDRQSLETVKRVWELLEPQLIQGSSSRDIVEVATSIAHLFLEFFPGILTVGQRFFLMFMQRQALRLADDLDGEKSVAEWNKDPFAYARRVKPIKLSSFQRY